MLQRRIILESVKKPMPLQEYEILFDGILTPNPFMDEPGRIYPTFFNNVDDDISTIADVTGRPDLMYTWREQVILIKPNVDINFTWIGHGTGYSLEDSLSADLGYPTGFDYDSEIGCESCIVSDQKYDPYRYLIKKVYGYRLSESQTFNGYLIFSTDPKTQFTLSDGFDMYFESIPYPHISLLEICNLGDGSNYPIFEDSGLPIPMYAPLWMIEYRFPSFVIPVTPSQDPQYFPALSDSQSLIIRVNYNNFYAITSLLNDYIYNGAYVNSTALVQAIYDYLESKGYAVDYQEVENCITLYFQPILSDNLKSSPNVDSYKDYHDNDGFQIMRDKLGPYPDQGIILMKSWSESFETPDDPASTTLVISPQQCLQALDTSDYLNIIQTVGLSIEEIHPSVTQYLSELPNTNQLEIIISHLSIV